jgi:hypothetical protein
MQTEITCLCVPVPPAHILERAIGYQNQRNARYLTLWWEPCGDEAMVSDGYITFTGNWSGYLAYIQHPLVAPELVNYNLGSSEEFATHRLLIDLEGRHVYLVSAAEGERILTTQWASQTRTPPVTVFMEDLESLLQGWVETRHETISMQEIFRQIQEDQHAVEALRAWMDAQYA